MAAARVSFSVAMQLSKVPEVALNTPTLGRLQQMPSITDAELAVMPVSGCAW